MKRVWRLLVLGVLIAAILPAGDGLPTLERAAAQTTQTAEIAPNRYIVRLKPGSSTSSQAAASTYDAIPGVTVDQVYSAVTRGFAGEFTSGAIDRLLDDPNVLDIRPDRKTWLAAQTVPPGIERIDAHLNPTEAGNGRSQPVDADIAILDTGIYKHPDLNVVGGKDCANTARSGPFNDISGHGTHVAGTAAAMDNGTGVVGVAPGARLWAVKVFSDDQRGAAYESEVMCGLEFVRQNAGTIEVINLSLGSDYGYDLGPCHADAYHQAYCNTVASGVTIVAAAQNWTINARTIVPAQFDEVITVSAYYDSDGRRGGLGPDSDCTPRGGRKGIQKDDTFACFSNYGHDIDISAPGMDVYSTYSANADPEECPRTTYCYMSGTSMSTPHVAGAVALIADQQGRMSPAATKARLLLTAERGPAPLDPDGIPEPMLNVAQLGKGRISLQASATVGERVTIEVEGYTPGERAIFRLDGAYLGGDTVGDDGKASRTFTVPASVSSSYPVTVSTGQRTVKDTLRIRPTVRLSITAGPVGETVQARLRGFGASESVLLTIDTGAGSRSLVRVTTSAATGSANVTFDIPASTDGKHRVDAVGNKGTSAYTYYVTRPSAYVSAGTPQPDRLVRLQMYGYSGGETVQARFDTQGGEDLGSVTLSATGSGSISVRIPANTSAGSHFVWLVGDDGNRIRVPLAVSQADEPDPLATATLTATATATSEATEPDPVETSTGTVVPDEPTATETLEPTSTSTSESTASPTETSTTQPPTATVVIPLGTPTFVVEDPVEEGEAGEAAA
ncbi:MAG: S8 family serine peptidase [Chloroflexota bacterium]|nr:S8 family serine peptidase [Chloroflexota bacterium]